MLAARGEYVLFTDADLLHSPRRNREVLAVVRGRVRRGHWVAKNGGRRAGEAPATLARKHGQGLHLADQQDRHSGHFGYYVRFQVLHTDAAQTLFSRSVIDDWSFDAEVLLIAQKHHLRIKEVPVHWHDETGTKVRVAVMLPVLCWASP